MTSVCICICTFRRNESLARLLAALDRLEFPSVPRPELSVVVVDNDPGGGAKGVVAEAAGASTFPVDYVHEGAPSIARARNTALDSAPEGTDLLALLDDDEEPAPHWLDELLRVQAATGADLVTGPVVPRFAPDAPAWVRSGGFFDLATFPDGAPLEEGITGNALLRRDRLRAVGLRFDERLALTGGEDQHLFRRARSLGLTIHYAAEAMVEEDVPPARSRLGYLVRLAYRRGNTLGLLDGGLDRRSARTTLLRTAKCAKWAAHGLASLASAPLGGGRVSAAWGLVRLARAAGMATGLAGARYDQYGGAALAAGRPRAVFIAAESPLNQAAGHTVVLAGFLDALAQAGCDVTVLVTTGRVGPFVGRVSAAAYDVRAEGVRRVGPLRVVTDPRTAAATLAWAAFRRAPAGLQRRAAEARDRWRKRQRIDHVLGRRLDEGQRRWIAGQLRELAPSALFVNTLWSHPGDDAIPDSVRATYCITHDVVSERSRSLRGQGYEVVPRDFDAAEEAAVLGRVPELIAIHWDDAERFRALVPGSETMVVPATFPRVARPAPPVPGRAVFVGSASLHNVDGLQWFLDGCWSRVRDRCPAAELHVYGSVGSRLERVPEGVRLRGEVPSLAAAYAEASVAVVALRAGSGLKVKLVEALCHEVACVSTSVGAQGLLGVEPRPFLLADEPEAFADAVVSVLADGACRASLEEAARAAAGLFDPATAYGPLLESLRAKGVPVGQP